MKRILLACNAEMSTSILLKKMQDYIFEDDLDLEVKAVSINEAKLIGNEWNIVLIGPQVAFELDELKSVLNVPVFVIDQDDYAKANGKALLTFASENWK
ncbi:PTS sugar transporter subunit IIB [Spiroplasma taiwanense]|uniref:PTS system cellobiose-specific IIB component n=1 Tax=Spiroplasma taiwanense CT-1 TaxID=1276220 RepID=S5MAV9_9MOLU|nr:PTS sugar transporter subunit IIB [Spiroplasma taiwanense]AGR40903.1 PTS system cellobiose-specific IIB component [Spiroplasma taiwanense CT-1]